MSALLYYTLGRMLSKIEQSLNLGTKRRREPRKSPNAVGERGYITKVLHYDAIGALRERVNILENDRYFDELHTLYLVITSGI